MVNYRLVNFIKGGECEMPISKTDIDPISHNNLVDLVPDQRMSINKNCFDVRELYKWINVKNTNPITNLPFTTVEIEKIENAYYNSTLDQSNINYINKKIENDPFAFYNLPQHLKDNNQIALSAVTSYAYIFQHLSDAQKDNEEIVRKAINTDYNLLQFASHRLKSLYAKN